MFLDSSPKDDESAQMDENSPFHDENQHDLVSSSTNAALLRYRSLSHSLRDLHPSTELSRYV